MEQFFDTLFGIKDHLSFGQECARAVLIFVYGLAMLRFSGKRTFARWPALDLVITIVIGSNLSRALTGSAPLPGTLAAVAIMVGLHLVTTFAASRSTWWSRLLEGAGTPLAQHGNVDERERCRAFISDEDMKEALRQAGVEKMEDNKLMTLETNGKISVIHKVDPVIALAAIAKALNADGKRLGAPYEVFNDP
ncbi:MAG: YetF domain-containing protein [Rhizomicrobium sp.]